MNLLSRLASGLLALALALPFAALAHDTPHPISRTEGGSQVVAVSAGYAYTCSVRADGTAACWGSASKLGTGEERAGPFVSIAASGYVSTCGVRTDGSLKCWGASSIRELAPAGRFVSVSLGDEHACGVRADGSVTCWGDDYNGAVSGTPHISYGGYGEDLVSTRPGPYVSVSAGTYHSCAVQLGGAVECWGAIGNREGSSTSINYGQAAVPAGLFLSVSAGMQHSCGVKADGSVACWGFDGSGQVSAIPSGPFLSVSAGGSHSCGVKADGSVACWGSDAYGQTGGVPSGAFLSVSASLGHTCGLKADGAVACWGRNYSGESTVPADMAAAGSTAFGQIAAGNAHACQVRWDGTLGCWGQDIYGTDSGAATPPASGLFTQVVAGDSHGCAIDSQSAITCWGRHAAEGAAQWAGRTWAQLAPGPDGALCALGTPQNFFWCRRGTYGGGGLSGAAFRQITHARDFVYDAQPPAPTSCYVNISGSALCAYGYGVIPLGNWQRLESGLDHQCGLKTNGSIECWGANADGQLNGTPASTDDFRALSVGWNHACAIRDNGQLYCWGSNLNGQATPPAGTYVQVAAGNTFTCAIRSDGVRVCWGDDAHGQAPQLSLNGTVAPSGLINTAYASTTFSLSDAGNNYPLAAPVVFVADGLPAGMSVNPATGVLGGIPTEGGEFTFIVEGEDANGFAASGEFTITVIADATAPAITYTIEGADEAPAPAGNNGWYIGDVVIDWTIADAESAITSTTAGCGVASEYEVGVSIETDVDGTDTSCGATSAGGTTTPVEVTIKLDKTKPTISAGVSAGTLGNNGWYVSPVTVAFTCNDALSGIASCPTPQTLSDDDDDVSSTAQTATDNAGNVSLSSNTVSVKIDRTAPLLAPSVPNPILRGQSYVASPNAIDTMSGLASASCGALDTSTLGGKSTSCTATDNAGNTRTVTLDYTVTTTCANDGHTGTKLLWCRNICENGLTGATLDSWIHRWTNKYRDLPYCMVEAPVQPE